MFKKNESIYILIMPTKPSKIKSFSFISFVVITIISSRCGKWILLAYSIIYISTSVIFYCKKFKTILCDKINELKRLMIQKMYQCKYFLNTVITKIDKIEQEFLKLHNISATISQVVFFTICEKTLIPQQNVTALYSLMFYNVLGYCFFYMKQMIGKNNWSPYINVATHSNIKHLAMSATKIVLEVTKAVTFIITVVFMLFVLCLEQRMHYYQPTKLFTLFTFTYYLATEKMFVEYFPCLLSVLQIRHLENLEILWTPVILNIFAQSLSFSFASILFFYGAYRSAFVAFYLNVYLSYKKLKSGSLKILYEEKALISQFRYASKCELDEFQDICAVCLNDMILARITPCHHIFHTECLRKCLQTCNQCPVCKRELKFS